MIARTPFAIVVSLSPHRMQVAWPVALLQDSCLLAAVAAGPAAIEAEAKSTVE
jgi:hypothetical protein